VAGAPRRLSISFFFFDTLNTSGMRGRCVARAVCEFRGAAADRHEMRITVGVVWFF
jgi:hypothetical protein